MALPLVPILGAVVPGIIDFIGKKLAPEPPKQTLDKDAFLKLLVEQLRHQDPLNPLCNDQFIAQTSQFQQLEELHNIRAALEGQSSGSNGSTVAATSVLLGRPVTATAAGFTYGGAAVSLPYTLDAPVGNAAVEISDAAGKVIAQIPLGPKASGPQSFAFTPGMTGSALAAGQYRYRILSVDAGTATALPAITGTVTGISADKGAAVLLVGNRRIALGDVTAVTTPANAPTN